MNTIKMHWVMDVVTAEANRVAKNAGRSGIDKEVWDKARGDVKTYAARLLAVLAIEDNCRFEDFVAYKGEQKG